MENLNNIVDVHFITSGTIDSIRKELRNIADHTLIQNKCVKLKFIGMTSNEDLDLVAKFLLSGCKEKVMEVMKAQA